jgi:hypothetical protein
MTEFHAMLRAYREAGEVSLVDLAWSRRSSVRLRNALRYGDRAGGLPFATIADYVRAGQSARDQLRRHVRNLGIRSARELDTLVRRFLTECDGCFRSSGRPVREDSPHPGEWRLNPEEQARREDLLKDLGAFTLAEAVEGKTTSARLENAIARGGIGERRMIDLLCGGPAAQAELLRIRNFGVSTLDELLACCRETVARLLASRCTSQEMLDRDIALVLDYDPPALKRLRAGSRFGAAPEPELPPAEAMTLRALLDWGVEALPERQRKLLARRYGWPDGEPETLLAIGADLDVTRERVRQLQNQALRKLSRRLPASRLGEALRAIATEYWAARPEPFVAAGCRSELLRTLPGGVRLALHVRGETAESWMAAGSVVMRNGFLAPGEEADRIRALARRMKRAAAWGLLPLPLERLGLAAEPWECRAATELETNLHIAQGFLVRREPSARVLRAMRLYCLLEEWRDASRAGISELYRKRYQDDPCSARDVSIVLHAYPHLFRARQRGRCRTLSGIIGK